MKIGIGNFVSAAIFCGLAAFGILASSVIYVSMRSSINEAFNEKMSGIGNVISSMVCDEDMKNILSSVDEPEKSPLFMKYYEPLSRILDETEASFLYLFYYGGEKDIVYIVDANPLDDEEWAAPRETEKSVDEDLKDGLIHAFRFDGGASEIIDNREWGVMKSGSYPIADSEGIEPPSFFKAGEKTKMRSYFMTGVDVTIGEIASRAAVVITAIGTIFLFIAGASAYAASYFSQKISNSVIEVKDDVLKIATGTGISIDTGKIPPDLKGTAELVSDYAEKTSAEISSLNRSANDVYSQSLLPRLEMAMKKSGMSYDFFPNATEGYFCGGIDIDKKIFVWLSPSEGNKCADLLKDIAVRNLLCEGKSRELCESGICQSVFSCGFDGKEEQSFGTETPAAEFVFAPNNKRRLANVRFTFVDKGSITVVIKK